jgi:wyosine [tRNA(Phe)-imidazoG37] synthetase (radical SAM superfamily)
MRAGARRHVYGPVPSRRLGRSLGADLVPFKTCTYDCIYCQLGRTTNRTLERCVYVPVEALLAELRPALCATPAPDYVSLAGSGEPTLHAGIGELIAGIKRLTTIPVAVLTNGSLLWLREVQDGLMEADLVLPSLDAGDAGLFAQVNRPHPGITFEAMVEGLRTFRERFQGGMWLEVLLLAGVTAIPAEVEKIARLAGQIRPVRVQLNTASRPPCEEFAYPVASESLGRYAACFPPPAEVLAEAPPARTRPESAGGITDADVLGLLRRRPCTAQGVAVGLGLHVAEAMKRLDALSGAGAVTVLRRDGLLFYQAEGRGHAEDFLLDIGPGLQ